MPKLFILFCNISILSNWPYQRICVNVIFCFLAIPCYWMVLGISKEGFCIKTDPPQMINFRRGIQSGKPNSSILHSKHKSCFLPQLEYSIKGCKFNIHIHTHTYRSLYFIRIWSYWLYWFLLSVKCQINH